MSLRNRGLLLVFHKFLYFQESLFSRTLPISLLKKFTTFYFYYAAASKGKTGYNEILDILHEILVL